MRLCAVALVPLALIWASVAHAVPEHLIEANPAPFISHDASVKTLYLVEAEMRDATNHVVSLHVATASIGQVETAALLNDDVPVLRDAHPAPPGLTQVFLEDATATTARLSLFIKSGAARRGATGFQMDHLDVPLNTWLDVPWPGSEHLRVRVRKVVRI